MEGHGLAADVRHYGRLIRARAQEKIGHLYPKVRLPSELGGGEANVTAWLWTRTVASPNPAARGKHVPLVSSFMLATETGRQAWAELVKDDATPRGWRFEVRTGSLSKDEVLKAKLGTRAGKAQDFLCFLTGTPIPRSYIQEEGKARRLGQTLMAVVADGTKRRVYVSPDSGQEELALNGPDAAVVADARSTFLAGPLPNRAGITGGVCSAYGLDTWGELFSARQIFALLTMSEFLKRLPDEIECEARVAGMVGEDAAAYASSVATFLALNLDRCADLNNALCTWNSSDEVKQTDDEDSGGGDGDEESGGVDLTTGWETLLEALISSGFTITATWPVRASQKWRMVAQSANTLASYIVLACRLRPADAPRVGRNGFVAELKRELPSALHHLQQGNVAPVDFAQAAIGPGMAVFSRYSAVVESNGKPMSVRTALALNSWAERRIARRIGRGTR